MAPIIEVSDEILNRLNQLKIPYKLKNQTKDNDNYVFVPSLKLYVAKERTLQGQNWFDSHKKLQGDNKKMPTVPQFVEFLKYLKSNSADYQALFDDITQVRSPWRAEWLDADFKVNDKKLYVNSNHVYENGNLVPKTSEPLDKNTLMTNRTPGISLDSWLKNPTPQGLPSKKVEDGKLYYWHPRDDNNSVARFGADVGRAGFVCYRDPSYWDSGLGVRAVRHE